MMGGFLSRDVADILSFMSSASSSESSSSSEPAYPISSQSSSSISGSFFSMSGMKWEIVNTLGKGAYGIVHLAKPIDSCNSHNKFVAVKSSALRDSKSLRKEKRILCKFQNCSEIVQCYGEYFSTDRNGLHQYNLLLEFAPGGDLSNLISTYGGQIPESDVRIYVGMLLKGLTFLHAEGFVHCDLKPENILVFPSLDGISKLKIADFGLVKEPDWEDEDESLTVDLPGTPRYMPPESVCNKEIRGSLDIWSLGCVIVEMLTGEKPWRTCRDMNSLVKNLVYSNKTPEVPKNISPAGKDFLSKILVRRHQDRWSASMLLSHPFLGGQDIRSPPSPITSIPISR